jgi:hypothetical protein
MLLWVLFLNDDLFRIITGLRRVHFKQLLDRIRQKLVDINISTGEHRVGAGGPRRRITEEAQLIICLIRMRQYVTLQLLA